MHARPVRIFALGAIALGGCVGTDGLTGGPTREQAPAGSASPAPVAPPPDAPAAPAADASAPDSVPRWCDAHPGHTLCEDFDELPLADEPWDALTQSGGPLALVPQGASTAKTLLATLVAGRPDLAGTYVAKSLASSRHLHVEADLRVERGDDAADLDLVVLRFAPDGQVADSWVNLAYAQGILVVGAGEFLTDGGFAGAAARVGVDTSVVHRIGIDVVCGTSSAVVTVSADATAVANVTGPALKGSVSLAIGPANSHNVGGDWRVHVDNVVVDADR